MSRVALAALAMLTVGGCEHGAVPPSAPTPHVVRYRLEWTTDGVAKNADAPGWAVRNDLGYQVRVSRGWVTSYSMELVECPQPTAATPVAALGALLWSAFEAPAFAGHNAGTPNPAAIRPMQVESLTDPVPHDVGTVTLAPQAYCRLHYLLARAGHDSPGLPADLDMVDTTLHVEGTWRAPDTSADVPFTIHTASAYGELFDHVDGASTFDVDPGRGDLQVVVRRKLGRVFDGVDFAHATEKLTAQRVLESIVESVEVAIERGADASR